MSIPGAASPLFLGAAVAEEAAYQIDRSLRFNSADSAYLNRTPSSASNRRTFTFSTWVKRHKLGTDQKIFGVNSDWFTFYFTSDKLRVYYENSGSQYFITDAVFRDVSAWYHLVLKVDTTQSSASDRVKIYANGEELTFSSTGTTSQNYEFGVNTTNVHDIGMRSSESVMKADFSLADVHFIDGQALDPTDFGEYDDNNVWNPIEYTGSYGTNGFHLDFSDASSNAALGDDSSGNNNDWTVNNLVATAGLETASQGFDVVLYTGNESTQSVTGLDFQPDFVWIKPRTQVNEHVLVDVVRGAGNRLFSNQTNAEDYQATSLTSFDSNGFSLGSHTSVNKSSINYVAWCWKANGTASLNENGSIDSQVSVSTDYGFSISKFTTDSSTSGGATIGHGLNAAPGMYIYKPTSTTGAWVVVHSYDYDQFAFLNANTEFRSISSQGGGTPADPTSSVLTLYDLGVTLASKTYVCYAWSEVSGFSKFGSYTGNGSTTGPVVTLGFKPRFVMFRRTDAASSWRIHDTARHPSNPLDSLLFPNENSAETTNSVYNVDFLEDGFQIKNNNSNFNASGGDYIYAAFASKPPGEIIDSLIDTPTNYESENGNAGGNYATLNAVDKGSNITLSNGNLDISKSGTTWTNSAVRGTIGVSSGKWYWEVTKTNAAAYSMFGVAVSAASFSEDYGAPNNETWTYISNSGNKFGDSDGGGGASYGATFTVGDVIGVALDMDAGTLVFYKNGVSQGTAYSTLSGKTIFPWIDLYNSGDTASVNFGQRPFAYTPPTGHKSLCTTNLTDPTIADGSTAMDVKTYTGNGSGQSISGLNISPDLVWIKSRSAAYSHNLYDVIRGADKALFSDTTNAETTYNGRLTSFDSTGFTVGNTSTAGVGTNENNTTYVGWAWDAGTTTVTNNTDGSITPTGVRANASAGFSIVSYTGDGSGTDTIGHGLNAAPSWVITKSRGTTGSWRVFADVGGTWKLGNLNNTDAFVNASVSAPTSSVFSVDGNSNTSTTHIAYCFAPVAGYSAFGTVLGTGSSDGGFAYTGFRPRFLLYKNADATGSWAIIDTERDPDNVGEELLFPNLSNAEQTFAEFDLLSNGIKLRYNYTSGHRVIFAAFAEHPFKTARAR